MRTNLDTIMHYMVQHGWKDSGDVESPAGHFALVEFDQWARGVISDDLPDTDPYAVPLGWYIVVTDNNGFVWPEWHGDDDDGDGHGSAINHYHALEDIYSEWLADDSEDD